MHVLKLSNFEIRLKDKKLQVMVCCQAMAAGYVMACELFAAKYRTFAGMIIEYFWAAAVCFNALLAYLVQNWVHLQLIISLAGLMTIPFYWYYLPTNALLMCVVLFSVVTVYVGNFGVGIETKTETNNK